MRFLLFLLAVSFCSCMGSNRYEGIPEKYHKGLDKALKIAGENAGELTRALDSCDARYKEGMAFLIVNMPERDLKELKAGFLVNNVDFAYLARERFPWAQNVPLDIFFNDVLPYVSLNEPRDEWRADFYGRFSAYVADCKDIFEAIDSVNRNLRDEVRVDYSTRRKRPDQSPYESMAQGVASCSGLSILLTDAFRSVGIPARVAGTPSWHDNRGNHNWVEVWADGKWYFTEYYPNKLNLAWFFADAGKAVKGDSVYAIYASSFQPADTYFPLVWDSTIRYVHAEDVTDRYVELYREYEARIKADGNHVSLKVVMFKKEQKEQNSDDREAVNVDIFCGTEQVGGGRTPGVERDMNDMLEFLVEKNKTYTFKYAGSDRKPREVDVAVGDAPLTVRLFME
ncbi:MAG: transglutaminase-like domain-containing protein [Culturomica sp.]|jgi:hypothetical protein|nr:transglutaminase-like domain-containing protein [Culturomica sp.]